VTVHFTLVVLMEQLRGEVEVSPLQYHRLQQKR
jgi:hypothetical protein